MHAIECPENRKRLGEKDEIDAGGEEDEVGEGVDDGDAEEHTSPGCSHRAIALGPEPCSNHACPLVSSSDPFSQIPWSKASP